MAKPALQRSAARSGRAEDETIHDPPEKSIEIPAADRETSARLQQAARTVGYLVAAAHSWLVFALRGVEPGAGAVVDGETAVDLDGESLDLVSWTRERLLATADGILAEAAAALVGDARADLAQDLAEYSRETRDRKTAPDPVEGPEPQAQPDAVEESAGRGWAKSGTGRRVREAPVPAPSDRGED